MVVCVDVGWNISSVSVIGVPGDKILSSAVLSKMSEGLKSG